MIGYVTCVNKARVISCLTLGRLVCHLVLWTSFFLMYGGLPQLLLDVAIIYYLNFIDDHSKFVWLYLLHHKSEVFQCSRDFQNLVKR